MPNPVHFNSIGLTTSNVDGQKILLEEIGGALCVDQEEVWADTSSVIFPNLPTSDPQTANQLWNDNGTLKISLSLVTRQSDLVGWWKYNESSGSSAADSSSTNNAGVSYNSWGDISAADWVIGKNGNCIEFDGGDAYVTVSSNEAYPASDFSLGAWVNLSATATHRTIFTSGHYYTAGSNGTWVFRVSDSNSSPKLVFYAYDGLSGIVSGTFSWAISCSTDEWHHAMFVHRDSSNVVDLYWDGVHLGSISISGDLEDCANNGFEAGVQAYGGDSYANYWAGKIDDVRMYDIALTDAEVAAIYGSGSGDWP